MLQAGDLAPEVALPDDHGTVHRLSDRRGSWTVIYFYPKDDTPGCTKEACAFRDLKKDLQKLGANGLGVSADDVASHVKFRDKHGLPFTLLSDPEHVAAEAYGVWVEKSMYGRTYMGIERATLLVGRDGTIARVWRNVKVPGHVDDVLAAAKAL